MSFLRNCTKACSSIAITPDALAVTLDELLQDCRVLCFDEFHVHDIGDAMLITRLFKALFRRGIVLLVTSNYPPEGLLPNPLTTPVSNR